MRCDCTLEAAQENPVEFREIYGDDLEADAFFTSDSSEITLVNLFVEGQADPIFTTTFKSEQELEEKGYRIEEPAYILLANYHLTFHQFVYHYDFSPVEREDFKLALEFYAQEKVLGYEREELTYSLVVDKAFSFEYPVALKRNLRKNSGQKTG